MPASREAFPDWMAGPLAGLAQPVTFDQAGALLCVLAAGYVAALWGAAALPARVAVGAIVALHLVFLVGPPLYSSDVFGYLGYARVGMLHDLSPYGAHNDALITLVVMSGVAAALYGRSAIATGAVVAAATAKASAGVMLPFLLIGASSAAAAPRSPAARWPRRSSPA